MKSYIKSLIFILPLIILFFSFNVAANQPINKNNWQQHAEIKEIRKIYHEIETKIRTKSILPQVKEFEYCEPMITKRSLYLDQNKQVYKYENQGGSDDQAFTNQFYYDEKGTLRFIFSVGKRVTGPGWEDRYYFNSKGQEIWRDPKTDFIEDASWIIRDPKKNFDEPDPCEKN